MYPAELAKKERKLLHHRRQAAAVEDGAPEIGVACSGGGIRSATVCLGVFQAFAKSSLLPRIDYISTISGGGYFGSFLGSLYLPRHRDQAVDANNVPGVVSQNLADDQSAPIKWLRKHGRYIAPNGPADYANIVAIYIRNWVAVQYVIGITFLTLFFLVLALRAAGTAYCAFLQADCYVLSREAAFVGPFLVAAVLLFMVVCAPLGWSFWLTQYGTDRYGVEPDQEISGWKTIKTPFKNNFVLWATLFVLAVCAVTVWISGPDFAAERIAAAVILWLGVLALASWGIAELGVTLMRRGDHAKDTLSLRRRHALVRNRLSNWLGTSLKWFAALVALALIDSLAQWVYGYLVRVEWKSSTVTIPTVIAALLTLVHQVAPYLQRAKASRSRWSWWTIASVAGIVAIALIVLIWDVVAYAIAFRGSEIKWGEEGLLPALFAYLAIGGVLAVLTGRTLSFLNLSSLQSFYSARLRRAYLGASNPKRTGYDCTGAAPAKPATPTAQRSIRSEVEGDDSPWVAYTPHEFGGPLHLLGVTVNHTVGKGSDIDLRDRKGFTMTMGPAGASAGIDSHALLEPKTLQPLPCPQGANNVFGEAGSAVPAEPCALSRWMAISGAAFSTGLGANTRTGVSVLLGVANVRLGYWWASGAPSDARKSKLRRLFRTQAYLYGEMLGRFAGNEYMHWYLSDGGHSENTGAYELIRRHLPFIVLLDNGADADYEFEDFGNLARRVRIDFGAEISPVANSEWNQLGIVGPGASATGLGGLRRPRTGEIGVALAQSAIALFKVTYPASKRRSLLVLAKPTLVGDEPNDVVNYASTHEAFPQEPTSDQFFDEAQWESYRKLGEHIGTKLAALCDWKAGEPVIAPPLAHDHSDHPAAA